MAAGILSAPGTKLGPCKSKDLFSTPECKHKDCAQIRLMADTLCTVCLKTIGYETRFYESEDKTLTHALCYETETV